MTRRWLVGYQMLTGISDTSTGVLLLFDPALVMRLMRLQTGPETLPFLSFIGAFVLSVGIACLYGAFLISRADFVPKLEMVWLLTAITRGLVCLLLGAQILSGSLESGWLIAAITDGVFALIQAIGLAKGWLKHAA